ncbi:uncharacterized protein SPSC_00731 [Sporisorium scitamineum]|uniref:WIBG Mago-binding domain-containing protein n=1 Tax=Sporisorium scitamineum TaxID=49012 RepID=A0A0F7RV91_9BASI|nr:hypothetical protein [Sporisorium scitamineum]CDU22101.1 uncharacterized protein SPSC_00731 [Sporisorium scitamineum]
MAVASTPRGPRATAAGIVERTDTQHRVIPESRRADGSIRKERKVRPGFTPVEDVVRYRPARAREAEEARKRGVPGGAAPTVASTSSSSASSAPPYSSRPTASGKPDCDRSTWRPNTARSPAVSDSKDGGQEPRGNFAPLEPPRQPKDRTPSATNLLGTFLTPAAVVKPWQSSRLRKPEPPRPSQDAASAASAVPEAWDQDLAQRDGDLERKAGAESVSAGDKASASDDLAAQLDNLRIDKSERSKDSEP